MSIAENSPVNWKLIKENPKKFWQTFAWAVPAFTVLFFLVAGRVWEVLPKIMGDELIYSRNARLTDLADISVPNYLFALVFESTNGCGYGFYYCAKGINLVFLAIFVFFVYLSARLVARPFPSFWVAALAMLGPISTYTSYFTPEMMFFAGVAILLYSLFKMGGQSPWWAWLLIGLGLGLVALVKPHGLFLVPPFVIYGIFLAMKSSRNRFAASFFSAIPIVAGTFLAKIGLGFAFAGEKGLGLFGGSYDASAGSILSGEDNSDPTWGSNSIAEQGLALSVFWQLVLHVAFLLIFFGLPLFLTVIESIRSLRSPNVPNELQKISFLLGISLLTMVGVAAVFVSTSASFGEMIQNRLMTRYYEYLLPFLPLVLIAARDKIEHVGKATRWFMAVVFVIWLAIALPTISTSVPALFTDSALMASTIKSGIPLWLYAAVSLVPAIYWVKDHTRGEKIWVYGFAPIMLLAFAVSTHFNFTVTSSVIGNYTQASRWAHENLTDEQKDTLQIVGNVYPNVQQAQFWVDNVNVTGIAIEENGELNLDAIPKDRKYVLAIGSMSLVGTGEILHQEGRFAFIKVGK